MTKLISVLRSTKGAIDLASIMVGIIVIGIIGAIIAATVFAVIPWAQDNAAKSTLSNVVTAESAYAGFASESNGSRLYGNADELKSPSTTVASGANGKKLFETPAGAGVYTAVNQSCYLAIVKSDTGNFFYVTDKRTTPRKYVEGGSSTDNPNSCDLGSGASSSLTDAIAALDAGDNNQAGDPNVCPEKITNPVGPWWQTQSAYCHDKKLGVGVSSWEYVQNQGTVATTSAGTGIVIAPVSFQYVLSGNSSVNVTLNLNKEIASPGVRWWLACDYAPSNYSSAQNVPMEDFSTYLANGSQDYAGNPNSHRYINGGQPGDFNTSCDLEKDGKNLVMIHMESGFSQNYTVQTIWTVDEAPAPVM